MGCFVSCRISTDKRVVRSLCHSRATCTITLSMNSWNKSSCIVNKTVLAQHNVAWILLSKSCKFGEKKIYYSNWDDDFPWEIVFIVTPCICGQMATLPQNGKCHWTDWWRRNLVRQRTLWVYSSTVNFTLIGKDVMHRRPNAWNLSKTVFLSSDANAII